jgi:hypothetical protein
MRLSGFRISVRQVTIGAAALAALIAAALLLVAWRDRRTAASLRERGAVTLGRVVGSETFTSSSSTGPTQMPEISTWRYTVGSRRYELKDRGSSYIGVAEPIPRLGPVLPDQPNTFGLLVGGGLFLVIAAVFGGVGVFLLRSEE